MLTIVKKGLKLFGKKNILFVKERMLPSLPVKPRVVVASRSERRPKRYW
jgi:hypothetical protein